MMETEPYSQTLSAQKNGSQQHQSLPLIYTAQPYEGDSDEIELGQIFAVLRRRALLIAGVTATVASAALLWALTRTPKYEGKFQLLVEPVAATSQLSKLPSIAEEAAGALGVGGLTSETGLDYETQIEVLKSPKLMAPIIGQLQARYPDISYDSLILNEELKIARVKETKIIEVTYLDPDPQKTQFVLDQVAKAYLNYGLNERQTNLGQGVQFIDKQLPQVRQRVDALQGKLQQFQERYSVSDPLARGEQLAEQVNVLEKERIEAQVELGEARTLYATIQRQLGLQTNEATIASALSASPRYEKFLEDLQEVEAEIAEKSAQFREDSPPVQELQDQRRNLVSLLDREAQRVLGNNLSRETVKSQALAAQLPSDSIPSELSAKFVEAANQIQVSQTRNRALSQAASRLNQKVQQLPAIARQYADLQRELEVASNTLEQLLIKRDVLGVEAAQEDVPWELIAGPELPRNEAGEALPASRKIPIFLGLGGILGLILGLAAALVAEQLNRVFHAPEEVQDATELSPLGLVPLNQELKPLACLMDPNELGSFLERYHNIPAFLEPFTALNTRLRFLNSGKLVRSLVISSALPGEGKSTVAVGLAQAAAQMAQRVLLVNADLRNSQQVKYEPDHSPGLAALAATDLDIHSVIQQSPYNSNLFVLGAGEAVSSSTALLGSKKMQHLMQQLQAEFDLVIYDTPSILGSSDSSLLAPYVDGVILVVRMGQTNRSKVIQALNQLKTIHTHVLGFVANGAQEHAAHFLSNGKGLITENPDWKVLKLYN